MIIRTATIEDLNRIEALLMRSYSTLMREAYDASVLNGALSAITQAKPDLIASGSFYVAERDKDFLGCGGRSYSPPGSADAIAGLVHARHFAVDPDWSGQGVGRAIFNRCISVAKAAGGVRMQSLSSLNAAAFYEKLGLKRLKLVTVPLGESRSFPLVLMEGDIAEMSVAF